MDSHNFYPTEIIFASTNSCNLNCSHCFVSKENLKLDIQKAKKIIESATSFSNQIQYIGFTGGEPFLYKEFLFEIIPFAIEKDLMFDQIMTNGVWWNSPNELNSTIQKLYDIGYDGKFGLSFDTFHNQPMNKIKTFINCIQTIFGDDTISIQSVVPFKKSEEHSALIHQIKKEFPSIPIFELPQTFNSSNENAWKSKKWFTEDFCQGPGNILYVHSDGNIAPCCGFANENPELFIGTINDNFEQILENAKTNKMIHTCFSKGLSSLQNKVEQKIKIENPSFKKCNDICSFCDYICKNLSTIV